jgi:molecular chaperone GrpE
MKKKHQEENETEKHTEQSAQADNIAQPEAEGAKTAEEAEACLEDNKSNDELAKLEEQVAEWKDKYIRLSAEFDNYRRRTLKEKSDLIQSGGEDTIKAVLPVVDDFERAIKAMENSTDVVAIKEGVDLIYTKFKDILKQRGVTEIVALNADFNLDMHEAITKIPAPTPEMVGKVVDVIQSGYTLNEKVIRFSKVVIGE